MTQVKIVFGMPENEYHAVNALSNSGIKELLVDPLDFWHQSWLNPGREEKETTTAMMFGKAFHALVLEGGAAFQDRYCAEPNPEDYPSTPTCKHPAISLFPPLLPPALSHSSPAVRRIRLRICTPPGTCLCLHTSATLPSCSLLHSCPFQAAADRPALSLHL